MAMNSCQFEFGVALLSALTCVIVVVDANLEAVLWPQWLQSARKPNIIIVNTDDMGWGDFSSYGHPTQEWGPIDDMAIQGMRFTSFYAGDSVCSPSRVALLTGRMPVRVGAYGPGRVFWPSAINGLPRDEITIAEALKDRGYTTGFVGKWHLGINAHNHTDGEHLPHHHGFDYVGTYLPFTNNWQCDEERWHLTEGPYPLMCFLYKNNTMYQQPFSHYAMSEDFVNDAIGFMSDAQERKIPFFLYYGTVQTHVDMYSSDAFRGSSKRGRYGDNVREMAWTVGAIMEEVKRMGEEFNTLTIFTSDNGPLTEICNEGGDVGILKGGKSQFWEGGVRVPGIFHWPGHIRPVSTSDVIASQMDIFPTLMAIIGGSVPDDRIIDGRDISSTLFNWWPEPQPELVTAKQLYKKPKTEQASDDEPRMLVFYNGDVVFTVRYGSYKFHFYTEKFLSKEEHHATPGRYEDGGFPLEEGIVGILSRGDDYYKHHDPPLMYNLDRDPQEAYPLNASLAANESILDEMLVEFDKFVDEMVVAPSLFVDRTPTVIPCCTPETFPTCTCNYKYEGPVPPPGKATTSSKESEIMLKLFLQKSPP